MQIRSHRQAEFEIRREQLSQGPLRGVYHQLDRFLVDESRKKGLVVDRATSPTALPTSSIHKSLQTYCRRTLPAVKSRLPLSSPIPCVTQGGAAYAIDVFDLLIEPRVKEKETTHTHTHTNGQTLVGPKNNGCARGTQHVEPTREVGGRRKNSGRAAPRQSVEGRGGVASYGLLGCGDAQGTAAVWLQRRRWRVATSASGPVRP